MIDDDPETDDTLKKTIIAWEKWTDPFEMTTQSESPNTNYEDDSTLSSPSAITASNSIPIIMTPVGIIPMNEKNLPGKNFNFWIGHTNFRITKTIARLIEGVDGVEVLDVNTPYRMRLGIAKLFNSSKTKVSICKSVDTYLSSSIMKYLKTNLNKSG